MRVPPACFFLFASELRDWLAAHSKSAFLKFLFLLMRHRIRRDKTDSVSSDREYECQTAGSLGLAKGKKELFALFVLLFDNKRIIAIALLSLFRGDVMPRQMANVCLIPTECDR